MSLNLPPDICLLESQVAGHTIESTTHKYGMLRSTSGKYVYKPLSKPFYAEREIAFYKDITEAQIFSEIGEFVPHYEGHLKLTIDEKEQLFIKMENLTHSMAQPCVMDIKIGKRTWDPLATGNKIMMEELKYAACKNNIGLCIPGFQIFNSTGNCLKYGKEYGKSLNETTFYETLKKFLTVQNTSCVYKPLVKTILNQLYGIQKWFTAQKSVCFYSSSILIAFDYEKLKLKVQEDLCSNTNGNLQKTKHKIDLNCNSWVKVKIIDFAHVFKSENNSYDANYLFGLQNLIYILQEILISNW